MKRRRAAAWLLSVPLMVAGSQIAHVLAYRIVYPQARVRMSALLATGHGYMVGGAGFWPLLFGALGGVELVAVTWVLAGGIARRKYSPVPPWAFGLVPPVGFAVQEFLERWFAGISFPWQLVLEPTFRIGLLLQIPFALAAFVAARLLLRAAQRVGWILGAGQLPPLIVLPSRGAPADAVPLRLAPLARGQSGRGPPPPIASF